VLREFYASIFALILPASPSASQPKFEHTIECVKNVREAWRLVARKTAVNPALLQVNGMNPGRRQPGFNGSDYGSETAIASHWNA
jgi:hypothetical protein